MNFTINFLRQITFVAAVAIVFLFSNCSVFNNVVSFIDDRQDFKEAKLMQSNITDTVTAFIETDAVKYYDKNADVADDPAIWYNKKNSENSVVFGSNKKAGIHAYNLQGDELNFIACGNINNIDVRQQVFLNNKYVDVLAGSNKINNSIIFFIIDETGNINLQNSFTIPLNNFEPYGFCLYKNAANQLNAFVNEKSGRINQLEIYMRDNSYFADTLNKFKLLSQVEGMVVDDKNRKLYVGEEEFGIQIFDLNNPNLDAVLLKKSDGRNRNIVFDIEGLALLNSEYLIASIQGNFTYAVFNLKQQNYLGSFKIVDGNIDGVEETDGLEIFANYLNEDFKMGMLIVQDGFNYDENKKQVQNFKYIKLEEVMKNFMN